MTQTIAQQIKWDFKTNSILEIKDKNGRAIYWEFSDGIWRKHEYDSQGNIIYFETSSGYWEKREWDSQGNVIYFEGSSGYWAKWEYNSQGNQIYFENSGGVIIDNRPKPCENKEIVIEGIKYKLVKQ
jgi:hypothetical protein